MGELLILTAAIAVLALLAWCEQWTRPTDLHGDDWMGEQGRRW